MSETSVRRRGGVRRWWIVGGILVIVAAIVAAIGLTAGPPQPPTAQVTTVRVERGSLIATVSGSGTIEANQTLAVPFQTNGSIAEVLVEAGAEVTAGQPLARLDTRELELQVAQAEASLESARARLEQEQQGNATPQEIAAQEASVANARAGVEQARTNNVTAADIASAEAALRSAQAQLDALLKGPDAEDVKQAQIAVDNARSQLESQRNSLSVAKSTAESDVQTAANDLRDAQAEYSRIYWDNRRISERIDDLPQENRDEEEQAQRAVANAEESLRQAQLRLEEAQTAEIIGVQQAEADVADAESRLRAAQEGASREDIVQAESDVAQRRADLQNLRNGGSAADIAAAQASLDQQIANLEQLTAPATETDIRIQNATVNESEQSLAQAQLNLNNATLLAPFDGVVTTVDIVPGSFVNSGTGVITIVNRDPLQVDLLLNENDVAQVTIGQQVVLSIDALRDWSDEGTVSYISPVGTDTNGVVTFDVTVDFPDDDMRVKVGMTANVDITVAEVNDVLLVPNTALLPSGSDQIVQRRNADGTLSDVVVETGLSDGVNTEIISGLNEGDEIVAVPNTSSTPQPGGLFGGG